MVHILWDGRIWTLFLTKSRCTFVSDKLSRWWGCVYWPLDRVEQTTVEQYVTPYWYFPHVLSRPSFVSWLFLQVHDVQQHTVGGKCVSSSSGSSTITISMFIVWRISSDRVHSQQVAEDRSICVCTATACYCHLVWKTRQPAGASPPPSSSSSPSFSIFATIQQSSPCSTA